MREYQVKIRSEVLLTESRHTANATISISIRNLYHTKKGLVQPSSSVVEITPEGARTLIAHLQQVLMMSPETNYIIHSNGSNRVDGVDYDSIMDYLKGIPSAE